MTADKLYIAKATGTNPYENLALESCLVEAAPSDGVILYLWQNRKTVVIGKNQNAWAECRVEQLERDGGFLARRPSGGGAVFHDLGNLNFSFVATGRNYDVGRQLDVIIEAMSCLGIEARRSGRNDLLADGRKFSGNAFLSKGESHCHHGTIMVKVDTDQLSNYLNVSALKLQSKAISSVKSRVCNLTDLRSEITIDKVSAAMRDAFGAVYGKSPIPLPETLLDKERLEEVMALYGSWAWRFGRRIPFTSELRRRFGWGEIAIELQVEAGEVKDALCYSDALDTEVIVGVADKLVGRRYDCESLSGAILDLSISSPGRREKLEEISEWLAGEIL